MPSNLVVIEDSTVKALMADPRAMDLLPCLQTAKQRLATVQKGGKNCNRCEAEKRQIISDAMRTAKDCIKNARGQRLKDVKKVLGTRQIRVVAKNAQGKKVQYTL